LVVATRAEGHGLAAVLVGACSAVAAVVARRGLTDPQSWSGRHTDMPLGAWVALGATGAVVVAIGGIALVIVLSVTAGVLFGYVALGVVSLVRG
jgi:hypothetical protein